MCATCPLLGNFGDSVFLKDYDVSIQNQVVCTLTIGRLYLMASYSVTSFMIMSAIWYIQFV